jgi:hypothetical protein
VTATAITVGGILAVSKIFLLIGLPVGLWQILLVLGEIRSGLTPEWTGAKVLLRLLPSNNQEILDLYTAGRLGDDSTLAVVTEAVLHGSPIVGYGAGGLRVPYDNGLVEALVVGGVVGAALFTAVLITLATAWWRARRRDGTRETTRLSGGLVAVVVGGAVGVPSLTVNRCSTVVWLLLALLLLCDDAGRRSVTGPDKRERSRLPAPHGPLPAPARPPAPHIDADLR